jgi:phosphatidylserine/phosphatidylglycerophosphate/cardiolipin synthase-like enzyme
MKQSNLNFIIIVLAILFGGFGTLGSFEQFQHSSLKKVRCGFYAQAFFMPDDEIKDFLLALIEAETEQIDVAAFRCMDPDFARALIDAHVRGVRVTLVGDIGCLGFRASKLRILKEAGIAVHCYPAVNASKGYSLMHHKFVLFHGLEYVWTGSMNFTTAAMTTNQENVLALRSKELLYDYAEQFLVLIDRATLL